MPGRGGLRAGRIILLFLCLVTAAALAGWFLSPRPAAKSAAESAKVKATFHLDTFVINLLEPEEKAYLRVGIDLGLDREQSKESAVPVAQVRDTVIEVLAACRAEELLAPEGKRKLKERILSALRQRIPELGVEEVYFTEFLIQR